MLIKDWMAEEIITVDENTSVMVATRMMKDNNVRRLPVVSRGQLVGIVTDRDLKDASPPKTSSLDIHEFYYLLSEMRLKEVMTKDPLSLKPDETLEKAALVMLGNKISGLPIIVDSGHLVGLISESDVLRGFIYSSGLTKDAHLYILDVPDQAGATSLIIDIFRKHDARLISVLTAYADAAEGMKRVSMRITCSEKEEAVIYEEVAAASSLIFHCKDNVDNISKRK